jgi:hypothetical protein
MLAGTIGLHFVCPSLSHTPCSRLKFYQHYFMASSRCQIYWRFLAGRGHCIAINPINFDPGHQNWYLYFIIPDLTWSTLIRNRRCLFYRCTWSHTWFLFPCCSSVCVPSLFSRVLLVCCVCLHLYFQCCHCFRTIILWLAVLFLTYFNAVLRLYM